ncbi:hypothetical protein H312_02299 [Anncaliia algerae PRA339]|uniref:Palmitoyltransferase n=1 Tax=Anncaliia algerae PRA339 TaxID=1288291 RepID=A0A059EZK3_9MICR|nr:hypothetical protein H312_02299 [Anncaliia algerae PRA339]
MNRRNYEDIIKSSINYSLITVLFFTTIAITLKSPENIKFKNILVITFCTTTCLSVLYLILTTFNTGYIPYVNDPLEYREKNDRYCTKCKLFKPERAHHCRRCNRCIKKMDHHCPWVGRCVNNDNLAHFIRFLFFVSLSSFISSMIYFFFIYAFLKKNSILNNFIFLSLISFHFVLTLLISIFTCTLFVFNLLLLLRNITFIEKSILFDIERIGVLLKKNPYDFGKFRNLVNLLGKPYFFFLFGENVGNGTDFEKKFESEPWPPVKIPRWYNYEIDV